MVKFEFYLNNDDFDRLYAIKRENGKNDLTGNDFAKELLVKELHKLHPRRVEFDENGDEIL